MQPLAKIITLLLVSSLLFLASCSEKDESNPEEMEPVDKEFVIYSDENYPTIPSGEIPISDQRFVGGANASDTNDGLESTPWATFDKALQELAASDTWYCLNIASDITVDSFIDTKFYGSGPGTSSQFAYIRSDPALSTPATLTLNARVEIDGQQNWLWYGFKMTGTQGINIGEDLPTNHHTIRNIEGKMTGTGGDNHGFFQAVNYNANYFGVFNSNFTGPGTTSDGVHGNTAAIIAFRVTHLRIENNRITNAPRPLYYKHSNQPNNGPADIHIRYNYQPETATGESCFFAGRVEGGIFEITDNIFGSSVEISNGGGSEQPDGHFISHNTFLTDLKIQNGNDPVVNATIKNNVIVGNLELLRYKTNTNTNTTDYQLYGGNIYYQSEVYTLEQWKAQSVPGNQDMNSIAGIPQFSDPLMNPEDYELQMDSPGKGRASDGKDIGAQTDYVGNKL
ncbi:hypothetical protein ATO12_14820 [Aquimarina atlantica]|uniref:Right handed beta helix domain-containing protein n=1 Tax=Aquimarina atlantica TaxID=1317122 RepID=A0A023BW42_9FLAO|nr:hypothetical protein [Aquimarina atlantica]EZH74144.1 hypothetical protein ATO12_14820 [Aquimarina atlantica]